MNFYLDNLTVASPCTADWNAMAGDDRVRHCPQCRLNVYNLSELSRHQAEQLLKEKEGKLCVRYFQRHDGTILTQDCPAALRRAQQAVQRLVAAIAGLFGLVAVGATCGPKDHALEIRGTPRPLPTTQRSQTQPHDDRRQMGRVAMPLPQPTTQRDNGAEILSPEPVPQSPQHP